MDLQRVLSELDAVLQRRIDGQRRKVLDVAHRIDPALSRDDLLNPDDHRALKDSEAFNYEDGILAGLLSAQILVRARLRELGAGEPPAADPVEHRHDDGTLRYRFCPRCGDHLALRQHVPHDPPRLTCRGCRFVYYLDPKVAAGVILEHDGGIVLGRRAIEPRVGAWGFPSGYVDRGERVEDGAVREVREEVGLEAVIERLVGIYSYAGRPVVVIVFAGRASGGTLAAGHETSEVRVFPPARIPWEELAFPSTRQALRDYLGGPDEVAPRAGELPAGSEAGP